MTNSMVIMKGIVQTAPNEDGNSCGFFFGDGKNNLPVKVYSPTMVETVMKYIRKGMTLRLACRMSEFYLIAEHIEIHRPEKATKRA